MLKKSISFLMIMILSVTALLAPVTMAEGEEAVFDISQLHCRYAILVDADDPTVALYGIEKNADVQCATGSTIKILTCIIAIEYARDHGGMDEMVTISAEAVNFSAKNSLMGVREGERWSLRSLIHGMMLPSGNDAAVAIAEYVAGSTNEFAKLMNQKAAEIGMTNSHFITVNGRDSKSHYSTARDMALLTAYALNDPDFCEIVGTDTITCTDESGTHSITLLNSDRLLVDAVSSDGSFTPKSCLYKYAIGVKTGDTNNAGKCFVGAAKKGGTTLIVVLLGGTLDDEEYQKNWMNMNEKRKDPYNAQRFEDAILCFDFAFKQMSVLLTVQDLVDAGMPVEFRDIQVQDYDPADPESGKLTLRVEIDTSVEIQVMKPFYDDIMPRLSSAYTLHLSDPFCAPIAEGDTVGTITYDFEIDGMSPSYNLIATRSVAQGVIATEPTVAETGGETKSLIGQTTDRNGVVVKAAETDTEKSTGEVVLMVVIIVLAVAVLAVTVFLIVAKIKREKRRKARLARKRRQRELMARRKAGHYDRYE